MIYRASKPSTEGVCCTFTLMKPIGYQPHMPAVLHVCNGIGRLLCTVCPSSLAYNTWAVTLCHTHHCIALFFFVFHSWHAPDAGCTKRDPIVVGKPAEFMLANIAESFGVERHQICMVGDRLDTDILFGQDGGLSTMLVLSGMLV